MEAKQEHLDEPIKWYQYPKYYWYVFLSWYYIKLRQLFVFIFGNND